VVVWTEASPCPDALHLPLERWDFGGRSSVTSRDGVNPIPGVKGLVSWRHASGSEPQHGIESGHRIEAPVEPENIFIEVRLQMMLGDGAMMGPENPGLEIGKDQMDQGQMPSRQVGVAGQNERIVLISKVVQCLVGRFTICENLGPFGHVLSDKAQQTSVLAAHDGKADAPRINELLDGCGAAMKAAMLGYSFRAILPYPDLDGPNNDGFVTDPLLPASRPASDFAFIHFDGMFATDGIALRPDHSGPQLMEDLECGFISR